MTARAPVSTAPVPTAPVTAAGLIGGYASARHAGRSDLATVVFTGAGAWCTWAWHRRSGRHAAGALLGVYLVAFWISHPLARRIGAWPSVLVTAGAAAGASHVLSDRGDRATATASPPSRSTKIG